MTLVETIIAFVIAGILIAATGALIISGLNLFNDTAAKTLDKQIADETMEIVVEKLQYAKSVKSSNQVPTDTTSGAIFVGEDGSTPSRTGKLFMKKDGTDETFSVFPQDNFYSGRTLMLSYTVEKTGGGTKAITVTVKVYDGDEHKYSKSSSIQLLNSMKEDDPKDTSTTQTHGPGIVIVYTPVE